MHIAWKKIIEDDHEAYSAAYLLFYDRFYNYGLRFTTNVSLVEDVIQEVLIMIWLDRKRLAEISNPEGYFFTTFRRHLFKKIKALTKQFPLILDNAEPEFARETILINQEIDKELQQKLQGAIDHLSARQREAIFLRFYEGLSYQQVAETLNITTKATYKLVARALLELKEIMGLPLSILLTLLLKFD